MVKADALALMHHLGTDGFTGNPLRWTENEDEALKIIRGKTKQHIAKVAAAYKRLAKRTLINDLDLLDEYQTQEARFIAKGDKHKSLAARLQDAAAGVGTKNDVVKQVYGGASQAARIAIDKAFASLYGSRWKGGKTAIENMFASEAEYDWEAAAWNSYRTTGKLEPGLALYIAMVGIGTDDAAVYKTLGEMKASDKMKVCEAFRDACVKYGDYDRKPDAEKMLRSWISADMDGGDFKRAEFLLFGKAETPKQMLEDIARREQNATRDELGVNLTRQFNGGIAADLSKLKKKLSAMVDLNTGKTKLNPATGKPYSTEDVRTVYAAGRGSIDQLAAAKTAVADALATGVEVSVAALTILISGSAATPFWVGLWSGMAALGTKALIQGSDRSLETLSADALKVLITSAAGHALRETGKFGTWVVELTDGFGEPIAREMAKDAILGLVQESAKGTVEGLFNAPNWREGVAEWLAGAGKKALKGGGKGAFDGAVSGAVKGAWQRDKGRLAGNVGPDGRNDGFDAANMDEAFVEELLGMGAIKVFEVAGDIDGHARSPTRMLKVIAGTIVTAALEAAKSRRKNRTQMGEAIEADAKWLEYNKHLVTRQLLARLEPHQFQDLYARKTSANTLRTLHKLYAEARASAQAYMDSFPSNDMGTPPPAPPLAPLPSGRDTAPAANTRQAATRRPNDDSRTDDPPPAPPLAPLPEGRQLAR